MLGNLLTRDKEDLNTITKKAIETTGVLKETDLAKYIPHGDANLSKELFMHYKEKDKNQLTMLIKENILDKEPQNYSSENTKSAITTTYSQSSLKEIIEKAMAKLNVKKESEICLYLPDGDKRLHHFTYERKKKTDPAEIANLIQTNILDKTPERLDRTYRPRKSTASKIIKIESTASENTDDSLQQIINQAMKRRKLGIKKEEDLSLYLPNGDSRMHPLKFRSMKEKNPDHLKELIEQYVLEPKKPEVIEWKRKVKALDNEQPNEVENIKSQENSQIDQILGAIQESSQLTKQLLEALQNSNHIPSSNTPLQIQEEFSVPFKNPPRENSSVSKLEMYFRGIQNQLISQIRQRKVDHELWNKFTELVENVFDGF